MKKKAEGRVVVVHDIKAYALVEMLLHSFLKSNLTIPFSPHPPLPSFSI